MVADHEEALPRIAARPAGSWPRRPGERLLARRSDEHEAADLGGIARHGIAAVALAHAQGDVEDARPSRRDAREGSIQKSWAETAAPASDASVKKTV